MSDLIDRQQAIGAVDVYLKRLCNYIGTPKDTELYALERGLLTSVKIDIGELPSAELGTNLAEVGTDCISRQAAIDALKKAYWDKDLQAAKDDPCVIDAMTDWAIRQIKALPSATQQETISEDYAKAVRNWLVHYQVKCVELQGRYTPYEVLGWVVSDWRRENEIW